jgi:hypothetical protein
VKAGLPPLGQLPEQAAQPRFAEHRNAAGGRDPRSRAAGPYKRPRHSDAVVEFV